MKIALLISGYPRSLEANIQSFTHNIIQDRDTDVFLHLTKTCAGDKYDNASLSLDNIVHKLNPRVIVCEENVQFSSDTRIDVIMNQAHKLHRLNEARKLCGPYDVIIRCRPDVYLCKPLALEHIQTGVIYVPTDAKIDKSKLHDATEYICDTMAYGTPDCMDWYCSIFTHLEALLRIHVPVPEVLMYEHLKTWPIVKVDIPYAIVLSNCTVIAIAGDSGTGKSTITEAIRDMFKNSFLLECDRYHKWERKHPMWNELTHLNPAANYITKMQDDVFDLKVGQRVYQVDYDHELGKFTDQQCIDPADTLLVCGLHSLYLGADVCNLKIFVEADDDIRIPWKLNRDSTIRRRTYEEVREQIECRKEDYNLYVARQKADADIIIKYYSDGSHLCLTITTDQCAIDYGPTDNPLEHIRATILNYSKLRAGPNKSE